MGVKHRKAFVRACEKPSPTDIRRDDAESLLRACGVEIVERSRSWVGLRKGGDRIVTHRSHLKPTKDRATIRDIAVGLNVVGVEP